MKRVIAILALLSVSSRAFAGGQAATTLLLPITSINATGSEWIAASVQQSLQTDLRNALLAHTADIAPDDSAAIARIAHNASATYVVQGHVQIVEDQLRVTASVFNDAGKTIGSAKVTGDVRHLFDLEDALSDQIRDKFAEAAAIAHPVTTPIPTVQSSGPIRAAVQPTLPVGTVPVTYASAALRDGRDRSIYQVSPCFGYLGLYGDGCFGFGGFGFGCSSVFDGGYSTGGTSGLAW